MLGFDEKVYLIYWDALNHMNHALKVIHVVFWIYSIFIFSYMKLKIFIERKNILMHQTTFSCTWIYEILFSKIWIFILNTCMIFIEYYRPTYMLLTFIDVFWKLRICHITATTYILQYLYFGILSQLVFPYKIHTNIPIYKCWQFDEYIFKSHPNDN